MALILLQDGSLQKKQVVFAPILPSAGGCQRFAWLLSLPVVPREQPAPGQDPWGADAGGRGAQGRGSPLPFPPGTLNPRGLASSRVALHLSKAP